MEYLAILAVGFCGGLAFGMHIAEVMLQKITRRLQELEQQQAKPAQPAPQAELLEDFA